MYNFDLNKYHFAFSSIYLVLSLPIPAENPAKTVPHGSAEQINKDQRLLTINSLQV